MLRSLPVGDEDGGGDQVPLGCYEGVPWPWGVSGGTCRSRTPNAAG